MNDWSSENMTGANIDPVSNNQKLTNHPYLPILLTALMLLLLFVTTAFIAYQTTNRQEAATVEVSIEDQPIPTSTLNLKENNELDWINYANQEYGFSLDHRPDLTTDFKNEYNRLSLTSGFINDPYENNFNMHITFFNNEDNLTPLEYFQDRCNNPEIPPWMITSEGIENCLEDLEQNIEEMTVADLIGLKARITHYEQGAIMTIVPHNDNLILFEVFGSGEAGDGPSDLAAETYERILSSFEFID